MTKEIKSFPFEFKLNKAKRTVEGYASTFGNKDLVGDVVVEGAFKKTITERADKVKLLWQHWDPLGKPLKMAEDSKGLQVEAYISKTQLGDDALELAADGVIDSFSIGYDVMKDDYDQNNGTRFLKELKLYEFSLVTFPANPEATITGVKSYEEFTNFLHKTGRMDVNRLLKEGRTLNKQNRELIETAIKALQDVLSIAEPEPGKQDPGNHSSKTQPEPLNIYKGIKTTDLEAILNSFKF